MLGSIAWRIFQPLHVKMIPAVYYSECTLDTSYERAGMTVSLRARWHDGESRDGMTAQCYLRCVRWG
jgi:hypothetical protein